MANPPITVGELVDVPAPESPINAQFHQEVANRIVHRYANFAALALWTTASVGTYAQTMDDGMIWRRYSTGWSHQLPRAYQCAGLDSAAINLGNPTWPVARLTIPADPGVRTAVIDYRCLTTSQAAGLDFWLKIGTIGIAAYRTPATANQNTVVTLHAMVNVGANATLQINAHRPDTGNYPTFGDANYHQLYATLLPGGPIVSTSPLPP